MLDLGGLSNVQRLRIGHGIYFYPPTTPGTSGMCRTFRSVLATAFGLASNNQLAELIFDVDISPDMWSFSSDSFFKGLLRDHTVAQIPVVRLHVLRGSHSYDAAARHCRQFAVYMGERGYVGRNILYSADEVRDSSLRFLCSKFTSRANNRDSLNKDRSCIKPCSLAAFLTLHRILY